MRKISKKKNRKKTEKKPKTPEANPIKTNLPVECLFFSAEKYRQKIKTIFEDKWKSKIHTCNEKTKKKNIKILLLKKKKNKKKTRKYLLNF